MITAEADILPHPQFIKDFLPDIFNSPSPLPSLIFFPNEKDISSKFPTSHCPFFHDIFIPTPFPSSILDILPQRHDKIMNFTHPCAEVYLNSPLMNSGISTAG